MDTWETYFFPKRIETDIKKVARNKIIEIKYEIK